MPLPTLILMLPPLPPVDAADPIEIEPVVPELEVPELKMSRPLTPLCPALVVRIEIAPLVLAIPWPLATLTEPPVAIVLCPAAMVKRPPAPLLPLPTVMLIAPPLPPVAAPEPIEIDPEVPRLVVPVLNTSKPLMPWSPAFDVRMLIAPLLEAVPCPARRMMSPPVCTWL